MKCPKCEGGGKIYGNGVDANGKVVPNVLVTCPAGPPHYGCDGSGTVVGAPTRCSACAGAGFTIPGATPNSNSDQAGEVVRCTICSGSGVVVTRDEVVAASPKKPATSGATRRIAAADGTCVDALHEPDLRAAYEAGAYEHACPSCGASARFTVVITIQRASAPAKVAKVTRKRAAKAKPADDPQDVG